VLAVPLWAGLGGVGLGPIYPLVVDRVQQLHYPIFSKKKLQYPIFKTKNKNAVTLPDYPIPCGSTFLSQKSVVQHFLHAGKNKTLRI
jgi:hypothetical protein